MFKGFVVLVAVGALFAFFVFDFVSDVEKDDPTTMISKDAKKAKEFARYYRTDAAGNRILDFSGASMAKAREVWRESPIRREILDQFPQFQYMQESIKLYMVDSPFRRALLKKLDEVEGLYLSGTIDSDRAKDMLTRI